MPAVTWTQRAADLEPARRFTEADALRVEIEILRNDAARLLRQADNKEILLRAIYDKREKG